MTKKEMLKEKISTFGEGEGLVLAFSLPYSKGVVCEVTTVASEFIPQKMEYIEKNYNDDLEMINNPLVKINWFA